MVGIEPTCFLDMLENARCSCQFTYWQINQKPNDQIIIGVHRDALWGMTRLLKVSLWCSHRCCLVFLQEANLYIVIVV